MLALIGVSLYFAQALQVYGLLMSLATILLVQKMSLSIPMGLLLDENISCLKQVSAPSMKISAAMGLVDFVLNQ